MSQFSSDSTEAAAIAEIENLLGGKVEAPAPSTVLEPGREAALFTRLIRANLTKAMAEDGVGVSELARRLNVSRAAISRQMSSEGAMLSSSAAALAAVLGRFWKIELVKAPEKAGNGRSEPSVTLLKLWPSTGSFEPASTPPMPSSQSGASRGQALVRRVASMP